MVQCRPSVKFKNSLKAPNTIQELVLRVVGYDFLINPFFGRGGGSTKVPRGNGGLKIKGWICQRETD